MKILVINGCNLNMLGIREKALYGELSYKALVRYIKSGAKDRGVKVALKQSNYEGELVTIIQKAYKKYDGIVINPGAYTHTSIAILDALKSVDIPTVEVHITDVNEREDYRKISYVREYAIATIAGRGFEGYLDGIDLLISNHESTVN